jgi:hypothetical protein
MEQQQAGPRLGDREFFARLDGTRPGLKAVTQAAEAGDYGRARRLFAERIRSTLRPELYFSMPKHELQNRTFLPGEDLRAAADRILTLTLVSTGTPHRFEGRVDWYHNPTFNQYKEWTWQLNRHWEWEILARCYRQTGNEAYAEGFVEMFKSWVRQVVAPVNEPGGATKGWRTIEAGIRMSNTWPYALHAFYRSPHFTDDVLIDWYKSLWEHGSRLRNDHRTGNWFIMEMNGLAHIGILCPEFADANAWKQYALGKLEEELDVQIYPDGLQYELSTNYHEVVLNNYNMIMELCEAYGVALPPALRGKLEQAYAVHVSLVMPDGRLPDLNDGRWMDLSASTSMKRAVRQFPERADFRWALTKGREGRPPEYTSIALPYSGYYIMRSGWDREAVWACLDAGPFGRGHQHEDKLNLLVHAYGALLLTEGGNYAYDDSEMRRYVLSTRSHNTIRVDGCDQNRRARYSWEPSDIGKRAGAIWYSSRGFDLAEGIYDEGYGPDARIFVEHRRKVVFLKEHPQLGPCFLVVDRLLPEDGRRHAYELLWHLNAGGAVANGLRTAALHSGGPGMTLLAGGPAGLRAEIVESREEPEWQGWKPTGSGLQGEFGPCPTAVYRLESSGPVRIVTLLHPTRPEAVCPVVRLETGTDSRETAVHLFLEDGGKVILDEKEFNKTT